MSAGLTIAAIQDAHKDITIYQIETHNRYFAMLGDADFSEDRLHDMLLDAVEDGNWKDYFESTWYPLAYGASPHEAIECLEAKVATVAVEDLGRYARVIFVYSGFIHDNFSGRLHPELENAWYTTLDSDK